MGRRVFPRQELLWLLITGRTVGSNSPVCRLVLDLLRFHVFQENSIPLQLAHGAFSFTLHLSTQLLQFRLLSILSADAAKTHCKKEARAVCRPREPRANKRCIYGNLCEAVPLRIGVPQNKQVSDDNTTQDESGVNFAPVAPCRFTLPRGVQGNGTRYAPSVHLAAPPSEKCFWIGSVRSTVTKSLQHDRNGTFHTPS